MYRYVQPTSVSMEKKVPPRIRGGIIAPGNAFGVCICTYKYRWKVLVLHDTLGSTNTSAVTRLPESSQIGLDTVHWCGGVGCTVEMQVGG